jgi:PKD repeat protein
MVRALRAALAFTVLALLAAAPASAEPGFEYEEAIRFGGFDESAYNHGQFGGPITSGKFLDPTGFAVDPQDNTVYVVDRTSSPKQNPTDWRIQQFEPTGTTLRLEGTTTFTLPNEPSNELGQPPRASAIEGLAVDLNAGRLYALVVGSPPVGSLITTTPVAQELLAWSTKPNGDQLEAAPGFRSDSGLHTTGALVSSEEQLLSGATPLYGPQGIVVDPLEVSGVDNPIAIEASNLDGSGEGNPISGPAIVQQVATQQQGAAATGDLTARWSDASVASQMGGVSWGPHGISASTDGTLTVLLEASGSTATDAYTVKLKADFSKATVLNSDANVPLTGDSDQAPMSLDEPPFNTLPGIRISDLKGTGAQVVQLSAAKPGGAAGPYAAVIFSTEQTDAQVSSTGPPGSEYWTSGENSGEDFEANIGVRLLEPGAGEEAISNLEGRTIVNTLGNKARGKPCNIGAPRAALAAGAGGTLWILDRGPQADRERASGQGREIIELVPRSAGSKQFCPQPSGTFTMVAPPGQAESEETLPTGEQTLEVAAGTQITFNAHSVKREGGKPFAYEWDLDGNPTNGPAGDGFEKVYEMQPIHFYYPPSSITYMYTRPGKYKVRFRMRTDYGVYTPPLPSTVIVTKAPFHPEARFTATPSGAQQVTFNATGSIPGVGSIVNYHWSWGDGGEEDEDPQIPVVAHTYAQPGSYPVTLTVTNSAYQSVTSAPQTVTVVAPLVAQAAASPIFPLYDIPPPFALYPIPPAAVDRVPTRLSARVRFAGGALSVTLACTAAKKLCAGTISIETAAAFAVAAKTGQRRHRARRLLLGRAAFSIPGGHSRTVKVRLSAKGMALLKRAKHLKVLVTVAAHDQLGNPGTTTLRLTLNAPAAHGRRSPVRKQHGKR